MQPIADRWTWPVAGGYKQRDHAPLDIIQRGEYFRSNWRGNPYALLGRIPSVHEGDDILRIGVDCYGDPVFSISNGTVTYSADVGAPTSPGARPTSTWRQYVVVEYVRPDGSIVEAKYAHLSHRFVKKGDVVTVGQQIGAIGDAEGAFKGAAHLHFAICITDRLLNIPTDWPSTGHSAAQATAIIFANYVDPKTFIQERLQPMPNTLVSATVSAAPHVPVYQVASLTSPVVRYLKPGDVVQVDSAAPQIDAAGGMKFYPTPDDCWLCEDCLTLGSPVVVVTSEVLQVNTQGLRLRAGPGTSYAYITHYDPPALVTVTEGKVVGAITWRKVIAPQAGWMAQSEGASVYLKPVAPPPAEPPNRPNLGVGLHVMPGAPDADIINLARELYAAGKGLYVKLCKMGGGFSNGLKAGDIMDANPLSVVILRPYFPDWEQRCIQMLNAAGKTWESPDLFDIGYAYAKEFIARFITGNADNLRAAFYQIICEPNAGEVGKGTPSFWLGAIKAFNEIGLKLACLATSIGNPPLPIESEKHRANWDFWLWSQTVQMVDEIVKGGHCLLFNEYLDPDIGDKDGQGNQRLPLGTWDSMWTVLRHDEVVKYLPEALRKVLIFLGEFGTRGARVMSAADLKVGWATWERLNQHASGAPEWSFGLGGAHNDELADDKLPALREHRLAR